MAGIAKRWLEGLQNGLGGGPDIGAALSRFGKEVSEELQKKSVHGGTEFVSGMYGGQTSAFVPYGPGQLPATLDHQRSQEHGHER